MDFTNTPKPKCKHCGRKRGDHKAVSLCCPIGRGLFPQWNLIQSYEPRRLTARRAAEKELFERSA